MRWLRLRYSLRGSSIASALLDRYDERVTTSSPPTSAASVFACLIRVAEDHLINFGTLQPGFAL
jgi:hypothetical protein